ncbi:MAG TPA: ATP-binding protein, partial [Thermoanaerobaculia bacterium]|nr:ATP-binding protein [Thermoanaerobaculia bacterium]
GVRLDVTFDRLVSPVLGDTDRLQQVAWNLLSNAVKFTSKGGTVEVRLQQSGDALELRVKDSGIGIPTAFLPFVFDRFRQAEGASTRSHGGLGLGLSIVRHLVELHGGTVHVESEGEGEGATFRVRLPVWSPLSDEMSGEPTEREAGPGLLSDTTLLAGIHVLVVEDEHDTRELITTALESCGAEVTSADSVSAAMAALEASDRRLPDVLVSDIGMPGEDGYSLIRRVRSRQPDQGRELPALVLTAYARAEDRLRALAAGFNTHLPKPLDPGELVQTVAGMVGRG